MDFNVIGIVGPIACGKGIITEYLIQKYGYTSFSLSSLVHEEAKKRGITVLTRTTLQDIGDDLRKQEGDGVLAKRAIKTLNPKHYTLNPKIIIEGIRNPGEVVYLRTIPGFYLIAVDAIQRIRYQRVLKRAKPWDPKDWESFLNVDGRDGGDEKNTQGQQVRRCMEMADVIIENNADVINVQKKIEKLFSSQ
jgi:dephospho-CoA kinase